MREYPFVVVLKEPGGKPWDCHVIARSEVEALKKARARGHEGWRHVETRRFSA